MVGSHMLRTAIAACAAPLLLAPLAFAQPTAHDAKVTKVYSLAHIKDAKLGPWLAETAPDIIQPESWKRHGGVIRFNASSQLLVVNHVPAVQVQVEGLIKAVTAAASSSATRVDTNITRAQFTEPAPLPTPELSSGKNAYLFPPPQIQPKHLFHFAIRYEGDGAIALPSMSQGTPLPGVAQVKADDGGKSPEVLPADAVPIRSNQLFHVILRYEGDGIVDSNVVELLKLVAGDSRTVPPCPSDSVPESCPNLPPLVPGVSPLGIPFAIGSSFPRSTPATARLPGLPEIAPLPAELLPLPERVE